MTHIIGKPKVSEEERLGELGNAAVVQVVRQLVTTQEMKRRGSGGHVLAGALGGMLECMAQFTMPQIDIREALHDVVDQFCDTLPPPKGPDA